MSLSENVPEATAVNAQDRRAIRYASAWFVRFQGEPAPAAMRGVPVLETPLINVQFQALFFEVFRHKQDRLPGGDE